MPSGDRRLTDVTSRIVRGAGRQARRQWQGRRRLLVGGRDATSWVRVTLGGVPVRALIDPDLHLPDRAATNLSTVQRALTEAGIDHWRVPAALARPLLGVRDVDRAAVVAALSRVEFTGWYRDRLDARNRRQSRLEAPGAPLPADTRGILVWPYVVADPAGGFAADQQQGVGITFWQPVTAPADGDGSVAEGAAVEPVLGWQSPVRNGALELLGPDQLTGLRGEIPVAARIPHLAQVQFPVDVVYTWVDGSDPAWIARKVAAFGGGGGDQVLTERAGDDVRFSDHDELRHSLRALEQFAPWVRHVWLVTGDQRPGWLVDHPGLTVVDHREIWPNDQGLPTFNSHAIESCLHRIPGLAEHFLYFNDDMVLGRPVAPERFFHANGLPKFFWSSALVDYLPVRSGEIASTTAAKNARRLIAAEFGHTFSRKFFHAPYPLQVSGLMELEQRFAAEFAATRAARFRTTADIAAAGSLYFNYAYATGRSVPGQIRYAYVDPAADGGPAALRRLLRRRDVDTFCINDGHTDQTPDRRAETDRLVRAFLATYLPVPSAYERAADQIATEPAPRAGLTTA